MEAMTMEDEIVYDAEYLRAMVARRRAQTLLDAAYQAALDIRVCIGQMRHTRDAIRYRELSERLSTVLWPRYRCLQDWRYER